MELKLNFLRNRKQRKDILDKVVKLNNRDVTLNDLYTQVYNGLYELGLDYAYIHEHMFKDNAQYVICSSNGKLYRIDLSFEGDKIVLSEPEPVKVQYVPTEEEERQNRFFVKRSGEKLLFMSISCAAVLNRIGCIDSRELFDSIEEEYKNRKHKGYLTYYHMGETFNFGEINGCFRYGNFLITYGTINEETVLGSVAEERLAESGWGVSIGFLSLEKPLKQRFGEAEIEIYTKGKLIEVSVLREKDAASYFTNIEGRNMGVNRKNAKELLLSFTGGKMEEEVEELLNDADVRERRIAEDGLITRENTPEEVEEEKEEETVEAEENAETVESIEEVVLDDEAVRAIAEEVTKTLSAENIGAIIRSIVEPMVKEVTDKLTSVEARLNEEEKDVVANQPISRSQKVIVTYRPSKPNAETREMEVEVERNTKPQTNETFDISDLRARAREQREKTLVRK